MVVVVSGSEKTGVGILEGMLLVIFGSGAGAKILGKLTRTVVVVVRSAGATVVVVVVGSGAGSTGVE